MTEFLVAEIGRRPVSDNCADRESYSLAAGLALGFVTLGHGARVGGLAGLADLRLENKLHRYMVGGKEQSHSAAGAGAGCGGSAAADAAAAAAAGGGDPSKCSRVREGPYVNTAVTAAGATLALGLMFLKSGNETVAARLALPDTLFLLDYVRPDLLMLRVIARGLVLWDSVQPTTEWLREQVPLVVRHAFASLAAKSTAGVSVAPLVGAEDKGKAKTGGSKLGGVDEESVRQAHAYITGGTCLAIGLRFVGTALRTARDTLLEAVVHFECLRDGPKDAAQRPDSCALEMSLMAASVAVARPSALRSRAPRGGLPYGHP